MTRTKADHTLAPSRPADRRPRRSGRRAGGCATATSPATGRTFSSPISEQQEAQLGREEHPKILDEFGGEYKEKPELTAYVSSVGQFLAATSERTDVKYTFTVLNTPDVNAFAVPGGYIYTTRGLLALANNEAELASVLGHETGHITARHTAERMGQAQQTQLGVLGATLLGAHAAAARPAPISPAALRRNTARCAWPAIRRSRSSKRISLGVRYMKRATYDPQASASFLSQLRAQTAARGAAGRQGSERGRSSTTCWPRTRAPSTACSARSRKPAASQPDAMLERDIYLSKIDGMLFGDDPSQGVIAGGKFVHPPLRFAFEVPSGYKLINLPDVVAIKGPKGTLGNLTLANPQPSGSLTAAMQNYDPKGRHRLQQHRDLHHQRHGGGDRPSRASTPNRAAPTIAPC